MAGMALGGCSVTIPMLGKALPQDEPAAAETTASVAAAGKLPVPFADAFGPEDIRRATGAMNLALDPQGNGAPVAWSNAESGMKGDFVPVGAPFLASDEICRVFIASAVTQTGPAQQQGTACRLSGGEWSIRELKPFRKS